jgi:molybdopterin-guanine dinucleotide biosynthesis protein A
VSASADQDGGRPDEWAVDRLRPSGPERATPAGTAPVPFGGVVLTGGLSTRMGVDKAFLVPDDGGPMLAERARRALAGAGAREVLAVGGDRRRLAALGFVTVPDRIPGRGPLGGLITGLRSATFDVAVVLSCDLPAIDADTVTELVRCLARRPDAGAALPSFDGHCQVLVGAYRRRVAAVALEAAFAAGERSIRRAVSSLVIAPVPTVARAPLIDVDRPEDLDHYARSRRASMSGRPPPRPAWPERQAGPAWPERQAGPARPDGQPDDG